MNAVECKGVRRVPPRRGESVGEGGGRDERPTPYRRGEARSVRRRALYYLLTNRYSRPAAPPNLVRHEGGVRRWSGAS